MPIRRLTVHDTPLIRAFFESLPHNTLMSYGRFNEQERPHAIDEILVGIESGSEIAFGSLKEVSPLLMGYLHFNTSSKFSRAGWQASVGIVVHPYLQRQRVGSELLKFGLEEMRKLDYGKLWLHVWEDNVAARKLYTRAGFRNEGIFERDQIIDGELKDVVSMARFL